MTLIDGVRLEACPVRPAPRRGRRGWLFGLLLVALAGAACDDRIETPIKPVVVTTPVVIAINISGAQVSSTEIQLTAFGVLTDGTVRDVTREVAWGSSNTAVAVVSPTGLVTAVGSGSADITATLEGVVGRVTVTA